MRRYTGSRTGVPYVTTTVRINGERQIETFEAMCHVNGRRPHEMAADMVLDAIREGQHDHGIQHLVQALRRLHRPLRAVKQDVSR